MGIKKTYPAPTLLEMERVTTHPGEMLKDEFLEPLGLSATALAKELGIPANRLTQIINKQRGMTADTAIRLGQYFGMSPSFWVNVQTMYDLSKAVVEKRKSYAKIRQREAA
jgi:antitoxin HigA-1